MPMLCWMDVPEGSDVAWKIAAISALQTMRMSLTTRPVVLLTPMLALGSSLLVTSMDAPLARYRVISSELLGPVPSTPLRSEEHTSELQSLMRISYAVFCLKKQ